ncbi:MAG: CCA tRNA nucleotidyltransferase [bacterium]
MFIPQDVLFILSVLTQNNFEAFIVGGCVRDYVLGNEPKDFDITSDALPLDIKNIFEKTIDTGIQHGTITVLLNKINYEVTTYRIDGEYVDNRHPESIIFTKNLTEDLSRRDFTMNALAYNPSTGLVDPFGGEDDIKTKIIRGVGDPDKRFKEDALRIMRGVRFASQLDFDIEQSTLTAMQNNAHLIKNISVERIRDEFFKLLNSSYINKIVLLELSGVYKYFMPELKVIFSNNKILKVLKHLDKSLRFSYILVLISINFNMKNAQDILSNFRLDNKTISQNKLILKYFDYNFNDDRASIRKLISIINPDVLKNLVSIKFMMELAEGNLVACKMYDNIYDQIGDTLRKNYCYSLKDLALNGNDLKAIGVQNGREIGKYLNMALDLVLEDPSKNNKEVLLEYVNNILQIN